MKHNAHVISLLNYLLLKLNTNYDSWNDSHMTKKIGLQVAIEMELN